MIEIAAQIPPHAKRVVELGCLREKAGEAFLRMQPKAEYWGITDDLSELREAGKSLTHVACVLPEELDFEKLGIYEADVLVIRGNYFRNMTARRLKKWTEILSDEGQVLLDMPNPAYIRNYLELLAGEETARVAAGMSAAALRKLIAEAGLHLFTAQACYDLMRDSQLRNSQENKVLLECLEALLSTLGQHAARENDPWLKSFFFKAGKKALAKDEKFCIQMAVGEKVVTAAKRVYEPQGFLATEPSVLTMSLLKGRPVRSIPKDITKKIIVRQRLVYNSMEQGLSTVKSLREEGYLIVAELDDNPSVFRGERVDNANAFSYIGTHCLQVSTEPLAEMMRQYNPHVQVFKNQLKELPEKRNYLMERLQRLKKGEDYVTFFFGALNRTQEWQEVMPVIREAIEMYGSKLRFKVLSDMGFYEALPTQYKEFIGSKDMYDGQFVPYNLYTAALHSSDISFLPLRDNDFNRMKSDLKFIESAGHGAVVLASPTVYEAVVREGRNGFIYRNPREFGEYLNLLIENRERRIETAEAAYNYVREGRLLSDHYQERLAWYREMLSRREILDREMMQRISIMSRRKKG